MSTAQYWHESPHPEFPEWQQIALVLSSGITGFLSLVGSSIILWLIFSDLNRKFKRVKYRFLLGLCISDIVISITYMFWSLPIPEGTPNVWGAMGNDTTCSVQGFAIALALTATIYNAALSHFFYRSVCYGVTDDEYYFSGWELGWHLLAIFFPCSTGLIGVAMEVANFAGFGCWSGPYPPDCLHEEDIECIRGENGYIFGWLVTGLPTFILLVVVAYCMWRIKQEVATVVGSLKTIPAIEQKQNGKAGNTRDSIVTTKTNHNTDDSSILDDDMSMETDGSDGEPEAVDPSDVSDQSSLGLERKVTEVAQQAYWYFAIYFVTHIFGFPAFFLESVGIPQNFWLSWLFMLTWPLQGLGNLFVFMRPRVLIVQRKYPSYSYRQALYVSIFRYDRLFTPSEKESSSADDVPQIPSAHGTSGDGQHQARTIRNAGRSSRSGSKEFT